MGVRSFLFKTALKQVKPRLVVKPALEAFLKTPTGQECLLKAKGKLKEWEDALALLGEAAKEKNRDAGPEKESRPGSEK
ncbi:MAG: hypothetical protein J5855_02670 [Mailhella sp.]|nr:hypothetical protein [Mailhella sp.]